MKHFLKIIPWIVFSGIGFFLVDNFLLVYNGFDQFFSAHQSSDKYSKNNACNSENEFEPINSFLKGLSEGDLIARVNKRWSSPNKALWVSGWDLFGEFPTDFYCESNSENGETHISVWKLRSFQSKQFKYAFEGYVLGIDGTPKLFFANVETGEIFWAKLHEFSEKGQFMVESFFIEKNPNTYETFVKATVQDLQEKRQYIVSNISMELNPHYEVCLENIQNAAECICFTQLHEKWEGKDCVLQLNEINIEDKKILFLEQDLTTSKTKEIVFSIP